MAAVIAKDVKKRLNQIRANNIALLNSGNAVIGISLDKLQQGDFNYDKPQRPYEQTLGYYAKQLREGLRT